MVYFLVLSYFTVVMFCYYTVNVHDKGKCSLGKSWDGMSQFLQAGCTSYHPTVNVKLLKGTNVTLLH